MKRIAQRRFQVLKRGLKTREKQRHFGAWSDESEVTFTIQRMEAGQKIFSGAKAQPLFSD
jgi:hypothetical protein